MQVQYLEFMIWEGGRRPKFVSLVANSLLGERNGKDVGWKLQHVVKNANKREKEIVVTIYDIYFILKFYLIAF